MKKPIRIFSAIALVLGVGVLAVASEPVSAVNVFDQCGSNPDAAVCKSTGDNAQSMIKSIINTLLYVLGAIAIIMIVVGGIRYTLSGGDSSSIKGAKDTVLYSVIGLVVAVASYAIVNFVLGYF